MITFSINGKLNFINDPRCLQRNTPDCIILDSGVSGDFISYEELFSIALQKLMTCLLVIDRLCGKLFISVPIMSDDNLRVISVAFFNADFKFI